MAIGVLYLLGGIVSIALAVRSARLAREAPTWPTVPGVVRERGVQASGAGRTSVRYVPRFTYEYSVGGTSYTSRAAFAFFAQAFRTQEEAQRFVDEVADEVVVHYDRGKPSRAYLFFHEAPRWARPLMVVFGALMLLVGIGRVMTS